MQSFTTGQSHTRFLPRIALVLVCAAALPPLLARFAGVPGYTAFLLFVLLLLLCLVTAAIGVLSLLRGLYRRSRISITNGATATVIGIAPVLAGVLILGPGRLTAPPIHDISTDPADPPAFVAARQLRSAGDNSLDYGGARVAGLQRRAYPDIRPLASPLPPARALEAAERTARELGWRITAADPAAGRLEATDTTKVFGFTDDIVLRVRPEDGGSRIDLRSASRVGVGDLGANAARLRRFARAFGG